MALTNDENFQFQPRLGPKPFSVGSGDVNFDKVFSVPQAPGSERNSTSSNHNEVISTTDNQSKSTESSDNSIDEQKDSDEKEGMKRSIFLQKFTHLDQIGIEYLFQLINENRCEMI